MGLVLRCDANGFQGSFKFGAAVRQVAHQRFYRPMQLLCSKLSKMSACDLLWRGSSVPFVLHGGVTLSESGPPCRGIHFSGATDSRPATESGYKATTFAGFKSSSIKVSMAESNFESQNSDTALSARMRVRLASYFNFSILARV